MWDSPCLSEGIPTKPRAQDLIIVAEEGAPYGIRKRFFFFGSKRIAGASKLEYIQPRPGKMQLRRPYCHRTEGLPTVSKAVLPSKTY
jgi:hypothetical protein